MNDQVKDINLDEMIEFATSFIKSKLDIVEKSWRENAGAASTAKSASDVVTDFDKQIEKEFYEVAKAKYPEIGFEGEEFAELNQEADYKWLIDPIDGTKYFARGIPLWCSTLALIGPDKQPLLGLVYIPYAGQLFTAIKGQGAFLNGKKLTATDSGVAFGDGQIAWDQDIAIGKMPEGMKQIYQRYTQALQERFYRARLLGSGALSILWVVQGVYQAFASPLRLRSKYVDLAGAQLIATESGLECSVTYLEKNHAQGEPQMHVFIGHARYVEELRRLYKQISDGANTQFVQ